MNAQVHYARAGRAGPSDALLRTPELRPLTEQKIVVVGLGCLGAASALEFARAGVGELRLLDDDFVDPATSSRWPLGVQVAGQSKAHVLAEFISRNYPRTRALPYRHRIGAVRARPKETPSDMDVLPAVLGGANAVYDSTAEIGVQHFLSDTARATATPYLCVSGTYGGWGGIVAVIDPRRTEGCWFCYRLAYDDGSILEPPSDPGGEVQGRGCGDVTFTGAGFDMSTVALTGVRAAVSVLCRGQPGGYPDISWDVMTIALRGTDGALVVPTFTAYQLAKHPKCGAHG